MSTSNEEVVVASGLSAYIGPFDMVIILAFIVGGYWWYRKQKEEHKSDYEFNTPPTGSNALRLVRQQSETGFVAKMKQTVRTAFWYIF